MLNIGQTDPEVIFMLEQRIIPPGDPLKHPRKKERSVPQIYPVLDNDLARDNVENDIPAADLQDLCIGKRNSTF